MIKKSLKVPQESYFPSVSTIQQPILQFKTTQKEVPIFLYEERGDFAEELFIFLTENNPKEFIFTDMIENTCRGFVIDEYDKIILKEYYFEIYSSRFKKESYSFFYSQMANIYCVTNNKRIYF